MAHGGPTGDPRVAADLRIVRVWQRRLAAGKLTWLLSEATWEGALCRGRKSGPTCNLRMMADRLNWTPTPEGWRQVDQQFSRADADYQVGTSASALLTCGVGSKVWIPALRPRL
eukprot:3923989-Amphidinium_carterae.2